MEEYHIPFCWLLVESSLGLHNSCERQGNPPKNTYSVLCGINLYFACQNDNVEPPPSKPQLNTWANMLDKENRLYYFWSFQRDRHVCPFQQKENLKKKKNIMEP